MKTSSDVAKAGKETFQPQGWSGAMREIQGKFELAGCIALMLAVYVMFLASVTDPYRPDIAAWIDGARAPATNSSNAMKIAVRN
jgi:hypothetical protein